MIDVKRLKILREVATRGSFSAAADELYLSQSAVSQQVATLEREVGMQLLDRTSSGPKLTDGGRVLVTHADAVICRLEEAERDLAAIAGLEGGEIRIASFPSASATLVTGAVSRFSAMHPKVKMSLLEAEPQDSIPALRAGELDLAIAFDYESMPGEPDRDLEYSLLLTEAMWVALPSGHPLAKRSAVRIADLAAEPWLTGVRPSSCGEIVLRACREAGFEPRIAFESDDYHVLAGFVAAGLGVTLLPNLALASLRSDVVALPVADTSPERRVWAATRTAGSRSAATEALLRTLVETAERYAGSVGLSAVA